MVLCLENLCSYHVVYARALLNEEKVEQQDGRLLIKYDNDNVWCGVLDTPSSLSFSLLVHSGHPLDDGGDSSKGVHHH